MRFTEPILRMSFLVTMDESCAVFPTINLNTFYPSIDNDAYHNSHVLGSTINETLICCHFSLVEKIEFFVEKKT